MKTSPLSPHPSSPRTRGSSGGEGEAERPAGVRTGLGLDPRVRGDDGRREHDGARAATLSTPSPTDAPALAALARDSFAETFGHLYSPENLAAFLAGHTTDAWAAILASPDDAVRMVEGDGAPVGYARVGRPKLPFEPEPGALELRQIYLLRPAHGTGVADELMAWVLREAGQRNAPAVYLSVFEDNARAIRFYARHGFRFVQEHAFMVGDHRDTDHILRRAL